MAKVIIEVGVVKCEVEEKDDETLHNVIQLCEQALKGVGFYFDNMDLSLTEKCGEIDNDDIE